MTSNQIALLKRVVKYSQLVHELTAYGALEAGWDGEDSLPVPAKSLEVAELFIRLIPEDIPLPKPMISRTGIVFFYWDSPKTYIDVEIEADSKLSMLIVDKKLSADPSTYNTEAWIPAQELSDFTPEFFNKRFSRLREEQNHAQLQ